MTRRWQEWVIVISLVAVGLTGVWAIWGDSLRRLWGDGEPSATEPVLVAPGAASGPF